MAAGMARRHLDTCEIDGGRPRSDLQLALDAITTIYAAYVSDENHGREQTAPGHISGHNRAGVA